MYSKLLLIASVLLIAVSADAQSKLVKAKGWTQALQMQDAILDRSGLPEVNPGLLNQYDEIKAGDIENTIGETYYDLQTNAATQSRIVAYDNGELSAVWTMSLDPGGNTDDRGTGYNRFVNDAWEAAPTARLESLRCGWPALSKDDAGNETVVAHATATTPNSMNIMYKAAGSGWVENNYTSANPQGLVWPKSASDGNTVHTAILAVPSGLGGSPYEGVDGNLLYYRSQDGGQTFDVEGAFFPGLDSTFYAEIGGDSYNIAVNGNNVAVAVFESWGDMAVWKSTDNGDTWTKSIAYDFPLDGYATDDFYTFDDISAGYDSLLNPDSLAILTNDGTGALVIDDNGMVHLTAGVMYVSDDAADGVDGNSSYFPGISGLWYWNESLGDNGAVQMDPVTDIVLDLDGNDTLDVDLGVGFVNIGQYFKSLTSYPTMGITADNEVVVGFSSIVETNTDYTTGQYFRHVYITKTGDGGATWADPIDMLDSRITDPAFYGISECVYPSLSSESVNDQLHMVYMRDFNPGISVSGDMDPVGANSIIHVAIPDDFNFISNVDELPTIDGITAYPNPTSSSLTLDFELLQKEEISISLSTMLGQHVKMLQEGIAVSGNYNRTFQLGNLTPGLYFLEVRTGNGQVSTQKIMVQ